MMNRSTMTIIVVIALNVFLIASTKTEKSRIMLNPSLVSIPAATSYFDGSLSNGGPTQLSCVAWPPTSELQFLTSLSVAPMVREPSQLVLHPLRAGSARLRFGIQLPPSRGRNDSYNLDNHPTSMQFIDMEASHASPRLSHPPPSPDYLAILEMVISDRTEVDQLANKDLHCRVRTPHGGLISVPFRVVQAKLGEFPPTQEYSPSNRYDVSQVPVQQFIAGNVAFVNCYPPMDSQPRAIVQFQVNGTVIGTSVYHNKERYEQVTWPTGERVTLLIHSFSAIDEGQYQCLITNPVTMEKKFAPYSVYLKPVAAHQPVPNKLRLPLSLAEGNKDDQQPQTIVVREGDNVTLFCNVEGAPIPTVDVGPFNSRLLENPRFQINKDFHILKIYNVEMNDSGNYICIAGPLSSVAKLEVLPRLRLLNPPKDVQLRALGDRAVFHCQPSIPSVKPLWLFNGEPIRADSTDGSLVLESVTENQLGVYQCVARTLKPSGIVAEWISASAILSLASDNVIYNVHDLMRLVPPSLDTRPPPHEETLNEMTPIVETLYDNLAVYLTWKVHEDTLRRGFNALHNSMMAGGYGQNQPEPILPVTYKIEYAVQTNEKPEYPALADLIGPDAPKWTDVKSLEKRWSTRYAFVTGNPLEAGRRYRFRIVAEDPGTGMQVVAPSGWSETVSLEHISTVEPPQIVSVSSYSDARINVRWNFTGSVPIDEDNMMESQRYSPVPERSFTPSYFLVLARPVFNSTSAEARPVNYGGYQATQVNGSSTRDTFLYNLNSSFKYQIVVYAVKMDRIGRQITGFSDPAFINLMAFQKPYRFSLWASLTNNKLIYISLGTLAALILLVTLILVILCLLRQRKDRPRRAKQNGIGYGCKENAQYAQRGGDIGMSDARALRGAGCPNGAGPVNPGNGAVSNAIMMGTLQRSGLSESEQQHQSQKNLLAKQQAEQYAAAMAAGQQQQQMLMGSQLQLGGGGYLPQSHFYPPQGQMHHQSHQSLLLSPTGTPITPAMFQSGTLPGGPRYLRQGSLQMGAQPHSHVQPFGSQQVLHRPPEAAGPEQTALMQDYYQQTQQQQQQQFYQPNCQQQFAYIQSPHHGGSISRRHGQQGFYGVGGPAASSSLKREPPTGGSMHEACGMDSMMSRGQMSPMGQPTQMDTSPTGQMPNSPPPAYFHGSQQALHMTPSIQYLNGSQSGYPASPSQQMAIYQQQQQQQHLQQQAIMMQQQMSPAQGAPAFSPFYPHQTIAQDGSLIRHHAMGHHADGDSIYSYFSQQEMGTPGVHPHLNPLLEENQMNAGFAESGSQTAGLNGTLTGNSATGSPAPGGHRHHRRRRRKQQQQPGVDGGGEMQQMSNDGQFQQQDVENSFNSYNNSQYNGDTGNREMGNMHAAYNYQMQQQMQQVPDDNQNFNQGFDQSVGYLGTGMRSGALPPPSQPPPPPPAPQVGSPMGYYRHQQEGSLSESLGSRGGIPGAGMSLTGSAGGPSGLLVGPPPRIRDYSEYGIPQGIHSSSQPTGVKASPYSGTVPPPISTCVAGISMEGRYREGQA